MSITVFDVGALQHTGLDHPYWMTEPSSIAVVVSRRRAPNDTIQLEIADVAGSPRDANVAFLGAARTTEPGYLISLDAGADAVFASPGDLKTMPHPVASADDVVEGSRPPLPPPRFVEGELFRLSASRFELLRRVLRTAFVSSRPPPPSPPSAALSHLVVVSWREERVLSGSGEVIVAFRRSIDAVSASKIGCRFIPVAELHSTTTRYVGSKLLQNRACEGDWVPRRSDVTGARGWRLLRPTVERPPCDPTTQGLTPQAPGHSTFPRLQHSSRIVAVPVAAMESDTWTAPEGGPPRDGWASHVVTLCPSDPGHWFIPVERPVVMVLLDGAGDAIGCATHPNPPGIPQAATPLQMMAEATWWPRLPPSWRDEGAQVDTRPLQPSGGANAIARHGVCGVMDPYRPGKACGSDTAHLSLFGCDPAVFYNGRGAFETMGAGLALQPSTDLAFKCNFATVREGPSHDAEDTPVVLLRRCDRSFEREGPVLCQFLDGREITAEDGCPPHPAGTFRILVKYATEHRCGLAIRGPPEVLVSDVSGTDPLKDNHPLWRCRPSEGVIDNEPLRLRAELTCSVVQAASRMIRRLLRGHPINVARRVAKKPPANAVLLRGAATANRLPSLSARFGWHGFAIAPTCIIKGLVSMLGMRLVDAPGGTGDVHSNYSSKVRVCLEALQESFKAYFPFSRSAATQRRPYDFAFVHMKGMDDASHEGHRDVKTALLFRADAALAELWRNVADGTTVIVTADHSTPASLLDHSADPVPCAIATKGADPSRVPRDAVMQFHEYSCARGSLGRFVGGDLLDFVRAYHGLSHR